MLANYEVHCDENWLTQRVQVERTIGKDTKTLSLSVEKGGLWRGSEQELPEVRGCQDVDLSVTPATNTIPFRRLDLGIGKSEAVDADRDAVDQRERLRVLREHRSEHT
jgi:hypothetical protein